MKRFSHLIALALLLGAAPALAATEQAEDAGTVKIAPHTSAPAATDSATLAKAEAAELARIETYLSGLTTVAADFLQVSDDGGTASGRMYLSRPGRMRFEYKPQDPGKPGSLLVADGTFINFYDANQRQTSNTTIESSLANFFLAKEIDLHDKVTVTALERGANTLELTLVDKKDPGQGSLILLFNDEPLQLRQWRTVDADGVGSMVTLLNPEFGGALAPKLFQFKDPNPVNPFEKNKPN